MVPSQSAEPTQGPSKSAFPTQSPSIEPSVSQFPSSRPTSSPSSRLLFHRFPLHGQHWSRPNRFSRRSRFARRHFLRWVSLRKRHTPFCCTWLTLSISFDCLSTFRNQVNLHLFHHSHRAPVNRVRTAEKVLDFVTVNDLIVWLFCLCSIEKSYPDSDAGPIRTSIQPAWVIRRQVCVHLDTCTYIFHFQHPQGRPLFRPLTVSTNDDSVVLLCQRNDFCILIDQFISPLFDSIDFAKFHSFFLFSTIPLSWVPWKSLLMLWRLALTLLISDFLALC